jgi:hypothetical protein
MKLSNVLSKLNPKMKLSVMRAWTTTGETTTVGELLNDPSIIGDDDVDPDVLSANFVMMGRGSEVVPTFEVRVGPYSTCTIYTEIENPYVDWSADDVVIELNRIAHLLPTNARGFVTDLIELVESGAKISDARAETARQILFSFQPVR